MFGVLGVAGDGVVAVGMVAACGLASSFTVVVVVAGLLVTAVGVVTCCGVRGVFGVGAFSVDDTGAVVAVNGVAGGDEGVAVCVGVVVATDVVTSVVCGACGVVVRLMVGAVGVVVRLILAAGVSGMAEVAVIAGVVVFGVGVATVVTPG